MADITTETRINDMTSLIIDGAEAVDTEKYQDDNEDTSKALARREAPRRESNARYEDDDASYKTSQPSKAPAPIKDYSYATNEHVAYAAKELEMAGRAIQQMYENNEINADQYAVACQNFAIGVKEVEQLDMAARANMLRNLESAQVFHAQTAQLIPAWSDLNKRQNIINRIENMCSKYGISKAELGQYQNAPKVIAMMADLERKTRVKHSVPDNLRPIRPAQGDNQVMSANRGRGSDIDQIAKLLIG